MPSEWEAGEVKDQRRHRYTDMNESLSWVNMTQKQIDAIWSELANDMENDVLKKDRVKKKLWCKYKERGKLIQWVYKKRKTRRNEGEGNDCLGALLQQFHRVCQQIAGEGKTLRQMDTEAGVSWKKVKKIHTSAPRVTVKTGRSV